MPDATQIANWPEGERRHPGKADRHYLALGALADAMRAEIERRLADRRELRVLDIGCGNKPYLPMFASRSSSYWGVDAVDGIHVDAVGVAENLPCESASFDVVVCTQVLEHVDDPVAALAEIQRVLAPGGVVFLSTHGVFLYHPDPPDSDRDYWRWTHSGLRRLVAQSGEYEDINIEAQGNVVACLGYIVAQFVDELGQKLPGKLPGAAMLYLVNGMSEWIDRRFPSGARFPKGGSLSSNYLVTARKPG